MSPRACRLPGLRLEAEMTKFARFDEAGFPLGFFDPTINVIPDDAVEITEDQWRELTTFQDSRRWQNGEVVEHVPPGPINLPRPVLCAIGNFTLAPFDIQGVDTAAGLSMAFAIDERVYWIMFPEEMSDANYGYSVTGSVPGITVTDTQTSYIEITAPADAGDSAKVCLQIFKVS